MTRREEPSRSHRAALGLFLVVATLLAYWVAAPAATHAPAPDPPKEADNLKPGGEANAKKAEERAARELQDIQALFAGKFVTIFTKDNGPVEGVTIVKYMEFRGTGFWHLVRKRDAKTLLLRCDNITLIRED